MKLLGQLSRHVAHPVRLNIVRPGDYVFIPANMLHVAVNRGAQSAVLIGSRNEATAQESVVFRPEMDRKVP